MFVWVFKPIKCLCFTGRGRGRGGGEGGHGVTKCDSYSFQHKYNNRPGGGVDWAQFFFSSSKVKKKGEQKDDVTPLAGVWQPVSVTPSQFHQAASGSIH